MLLTAENLEEALLKPRSVEAWDSIFNKALIDRNLFDKLVYLSFGQNEKVKLRASWLMDKVAEQNREFVSEDLINHIAKHVAESNNDGVRRTCLRMLAREELPNECLGLVTDISFRWLDSSSTPVAVKVHAMKILYKVSLVHTEIANELKLIIENQLPTGTAGFRSRGKKIMAQLQKNIPKVNFMQR